LSVPARTYLAWASIVDEISAETIVLDSVQVKQAKQQQKESERTLQQMVRDGYRWLLCPGEELQKGKHVLHWDKASLSSTAPNLVQEIENKIHDEEWIITSWSPIHLKKILEDWYFKDGVDQISALKVWQDSCQYLYLPRLAHDGVYKDAIMEGIQTEDFFGYAVNRIGNDYEGFLFGRSGLINLDEHTVLIAKDTAAIYKQKIDPPPIPDSTANDGDDTGIGEPDVEAGDEIDTSTDKLPTRFFGLKKLDPIGAQMEFSEIITEVVQHFSSKVGTDVEITLEISAKTKDGFDEKLQRDVKENARTLGFKEMGFETDSK